MDRHLNKVLNGIRDRIPFSNFFKKISKRCVAGLTGRDASLSNDRIRWVLTDSGGRMGAAD